MALNNDDLFLVNQGGESKKITYQNLKNNLTSDRIDQGPLAGFRNVIINGDLEINHRGVDIASVATGDYGQDRWKKTTGGMTQIIEAGNFEPSTTYTLSGTNVTTQQLMAPDSGNWTLPDIPVTARKIQLEPGPVATPFEQRPIGIEISLCERYYQRISLDGVVYNANSDVTEARIAVPLRTAMRLASPAFESREGRTRISTSDGEYSNSSVDNYYGINSISGCSDPLATCILNIDRESNSGKKLVTIVGDNVATQFNLDAEL